MNKIVVDISASFSGPDLDRIIAEKDCNAILALTERDVREATVEQQSKPSSLVAGYNLGGMFGDLGSW